MLYMLKPEDAMRAWQPCKRTATGKRAQMRSSAVVRHIEATFFSNQEVAAAWRTGVLRLAMQPGFPYLRRRRIAQVAKIYICGIARRAADVKLRPRRSKEFLVGELHDLLQGGLQRQSRLRLARRPHLAGPAGHAAFGDRQRHPR